ncbi:MAG TPA: sensor histidine kinase [Thermoanaerobaculia bacterium]|nr:sensor histidine kinase [Thermoanaerobaculia bacterium]
MRLLPKDPHLSWTRYAYLIYIVPFVAAPFAGPAPVALRIAAVAGTVLFLFLYFRAYWLPGAKVLWIVAALVALGAVFAPFNSWASVLFVYAASFLGRAGPPRLAVRGLALLLAGIALESWWLRLPMEFWIPAALFSLLIGGITIHFYDAEKTRERLRESQREVEHLARIAERERIGRDLHDLLGHTLSLITLKAELAARLAGKDPARAESEMREVERISRQALREVRSAVAGYRSEGLQAELARARLALESAGVRQEYFTMPIELPAAQETALALALREAVTNVMRHAGAATCRITLEQAAGVTRLEVGDDGRGGLAPEGHGLRAMRERIDGLGGRLERRGEGGTRLVITLPAAAGPVPASDAASPAVPEAVMGHAAG